MDKVVNVKEISKEMRDPSIIMKAFNELAPGESIELINDHEPRPLLAKFQAEHAGEFEWWPLEQGPETWRIRIKKRDTAVPERTITDFFQSDHRRLDEIFRAFTDEVEGRRWEDALVHIKEFSLGLKNHIQAEEEILFPAFEQKTGMFGGGPTQVMRMEHMDIREFLDRAVKATADRDEAAVEEARSALVTYLLDHNMKEENILYPESDSFLDDSERAEIIQKAQRVSPGD